MTGIEKSFTITLWIFKKNSFWLKNAKSQNLFITYLRNIMLRKRFKNDFFVFFRAIFIILKEPVIDICHVSFFAFSV